MLFFIALIAAAIVGFMLWRAMSRQPTGRPRRPSQAPRISAPDDDPEFLRQLGERLRSEGEDPPTRR